MIFPPKNLNSFDISTLDILLKWAKSRLYQVACDRKTSILRSLLTFLIADKNNFICLCNKMLKNSGRRLYCLRHEGKNWQAFGIQRICWSTCVDSCQWCEWKCSWRRWFLNKKDIKIERANQCVANWPSGMTHSKSNLAVRISHKRLSLSTCCVSAQPNWCDYFYWWESR